MKEDIFDLIPKNIIKQLEKQNITKLRPSQEKSIKKGLFKNNHNQLIVTPTGSGKTLVGELAMLDTFLNKHKKAVYIVPLKALASEKFREFKESYGNEFKIRVSVGEVQNERYTYDYDLLIVTAEKLDSIIRHDKSVLENLGLVIIDEIHLLNDGKRGPTLEILMTIFKTKYRNIRLIGLSATIGNSKELAKWLRADLIEDEWRPVKLEHHILLNNELIRYK